MRLYRLNVSRPSAGREVPFDRIYLACGENRKLLKRLFEYAIVMPLAGELKTQLERLTPDFKRSVTTSDKLVNTEKQELAIGEWGNLLNSARDWVLVTPILPKVGRDIKPMYLTNLSWHERATYKKQRLKTSPLPTLAYLQTPEKNYRPVCIACPRFTEHMEGLCQPGQKVCLTSLVLGTPITTPSNETPDVRLNADQPISDVP